MEKINEHFFYCLLCRDGTFYAGYTNNLERRIKLHNEGKGAKYTRGRGPVQLIYIKAFEHKSEALRMEYEFKKWTRKRKEQFLLNETGGNYVGTKEL